MNIRDLVTLRRAKDRMDREFDQPLDVPALARSAAMSTGAAMGRRLRSSTVLNLRALAVDVSAVRDGRAKAFHASDQALRGEGPSGPWHFRGLSSAVGSGIGSARDVVAA